MKINGGRYVIDTKSISLYSSNLDPKSIINSDNVIVIIVNTDQIAIPIIPTNFNKG